MPTITKTISISRQEEDGLTRFLVQNFRKQSVYLDGADGDRFYAAVQQCTTTSEALVLGDCLPANVNDSDGVELYIENIGTNSVDVIISGGSDIHLTRLATGEFCYLPNHNLSNGGLAAKIKAVTGEGSVYVVANQRT